MKIIETTTNYVGHEIAEYSGKRVRIQAVMRTGVDADGDEYYVQDDDTLERLGGVKKYDRVEVAEVRANGTVRYVTCDVRAIDLECFASLKDRFDDNNRTVPTDAYKRIPEDTFAAIARFHLHIMTLQSRQPPSLDFHVVGFWQVRAALNAAFRAGVDSGVTEQCHYMHYPG